MSVIATALRSVVTTVSMGSAPYGVAITPSGAFAYVTDNDLSTVSLIDTGSNTVIGSPIPVGDQPTGIAITPNGALAYTTNNTYSSVTVISLAGPASGTNFPTAPLQAYAINETDSCGKSAPASVNLPGLMNSQFTGWGKSWQQWPNNGAGGFVCVRQPYFTSTGTWSVG